jgi:serine/tyrosine/threonine adenylyltransferase
MRQIIMFNNTYSKLPAHFFERVLPTPVPAPQLIKLNVPLAQELGLDTDWLQTNEGIAMLAGNFVPQGAELIACVYAGHQFGHFSPKLGDGRAILLGELIDVHGNRRDMQLKGAGQTPYSRRGDGRAALGSVLREYIMSEAMFALGIPTSRALACVTTGEGVVRETVLPGAVFTRIAASHIRIGTFQYFAAQGDIEAVKTLADYAIARHYPDVALAQNPYAALLNGVITRQAELVAKWLNIGFIHGVMNTDNMSISGETIDYGPCAFMDVYDPATVFSFIDKNGRYAYANQPRIAQWNLARFAETLMPLLGSETQAMGVAQSAINGFVSVFEAAYFGGLRAKLGLLKIEVDDEQLIRDLLVLLAENRQDYTIFFRTLCENDVSVAQGFENWILRWRERAARETQDQQTRIALMKSVNPCYIPRNYLMEEMISAAIERDDYTPFEQLLLVLAKPYEERAEFARYADKPKIFEGQYNTYCGT